MDTIQNLVEYVLSFQAYTLLPLFIFVFTIILGIPLSKSIPATLSIAVGFVGIFLVFDFFVAALGPAVEALAIRTGLDYPVLDVGWPPLAAITWAFPLAAVLIPVILGVNILLLLPGWTKTVNIDLWNFWHFIFLGAMTFQLTGNAWLAVAMAILAEVITLKLADAARFQVAEFAEMKGITVSPLSALTYYPIGLAGNWIIDRIPGLRDINADPESIRKKLGILGEPMVLGFLIGSGLGIAGGYQTRELLDLAVKFAAVVALLPVMTGILGKGLMVVSEGMTLFLQKRVPKFSQSVIALDNAIIVGKPAVIVSGLILIPIALILALVLPGVRFLPIGDLANMVGLVIMITVASRGNVIRSVLISIPAVVGSLYVAGALAPMFTALAFDAGFTVPGYSGEITAFLDGGNLIRAFLIGLLQASPWALGFIPVVLLLGFATWKLGGKPVSESVSEPGQDGSPAEDQEA
jgi:PTS system galactitol-specific IIC component